MSQLPLVMKIGDLEIPVDRLTIKPLEKSTEAIAELKKREPVIKFWSSENIQDNWQAGDWAQVIEPGSKLIKHDDNPKARAEEEEFEPGSIGRRCTKTLPPIDMLSQHRKIAYVSPMALMTFFGNWRRSEFIEVAQFDDCEGATVLNVFYRPEMRMFGVELARMDWPCVADGTIAPTLNSSGACRVVKIEAKPL